MSDIEVDGMCVEEVENFIRVNCERDICFSIEELARQLGRYGQWTERSIIKAILVLDDEIEDINLRWVVDRLYVGVYKEVKYNDR